MNKILVMGLLALGLAGLSVQAADTNAPVPFVYGSLETPLLSSFYSRGRLFDNREVFEPSVTINKDTLGGTLSFNYFGNLGLREPTSPGNSERYTETDLTGSYSETINLATFTVGYIEYIYNGQTVPNSREVFASVALDMQKSIFVNPTASIFYDFKDANGFYGVAGLNHTFTINKKLSLVADTSLGAASANYNEFYFGVDKTRLNDWSSGLALNYALTDKVTLIAGARYGIMVDEDVRQGAFDVFGAGEKWTAKLSALYSF